MIVFDLQVYKLMKSTLTEFDVNQSSFTTNCSVYLHGLRFSNNLNFVIEKPWTKLVQKPDVIPIFGS